jgi:hypothetical protein
MSVIQTSNPELVIPPMISNICTTYINTKLDQLYRDDTEADLHVRLNTSWERNKFNRISVTSLAVPITSYLVPEGKRLRCTITDVNTTQQATVDYTFAGGQITQVSQFVSLLNGLIYEKNNNAAFENYFYYDSDIDTENLGNINTPLDRGLITGKIYALRNFTIQFVEGGDVFAPIMGFDNKDTTERLLRDYIQSPVEILKRTYNFDDPNKGTSTNHAYYVAPYVADPIPYSIIYLCCDECSNGIQNTNGTSILASLFYDNQDNFKYIKQDFAFQQNSKIITKKANELHLYFLDENKKRISNFQGIPAFITIVLYHEPTDSDIP